MTPQERESTAATVAGIAARGYAMHVRDHGPDSSFAVLAEGGGRFLVTATTDGAASFVERDGERFAVHVIPAAIFDAEVTQS